MDTKELQGLRNRRVSVSVNFPLSLLAVIDRLSESVGNSTTGTVVQLVREALQARNKGTKQRT